MLSTLDLVRCRIGDETYACERSSVASVHQAAELRRGSPSDAGKELGFIATSRTDRVPAFGLADCLQASDRCNAAPRGHVIVLHSSLGSQGFLVDAVSRVVSVPAELVRPVPALLNDPTRRLFKAVVLFREAGQSDSLSLLLSPERLHRDAVPLPDESRLDTPVRTAVDESCKSDKNVHPTNAGQLVVFALASQPQAGRTLLCGLSAAQVVEIVERRPIQRVPFAPPGVEGFLLWRDQAVPVLNLGLSLGVSENTAHERLVVVRHQREFLALPAPQAVQARRLPLPHQPISPPVDWNAGVVRGAFQADGEWIVIPDLSGRSRKLPACGLATAN